MKIEIRNGPIQPYREVEQFQSALERTGKFGATACFTGTLRDFNEGRAIHGMSLEHYPGMTEKHIGEICGRAADRWSLLDCLVIHRTGEIGIGEAIVVIAVWAVHRGDAMAACRYILEDLKSQAPFWKKEKFAQGEAWVERNTSGFKSEV